MEGSVEELVSDFTQAMDTFFPIQTVKLHSNDKPWMSVSIKQLIIARQQAFSCGNIDLWRHCKGKVKHAIQLKKKNFYSDKVRHLKKSDCRSWWKLITNFLADQILLHQSTLRRTVSYLLMTIW